MVKEITIRNELIYVSDNQKKRKLKNSYCGYWALKAKGNDKLKRVLFFTSSERKRIKDEVRNEKE